MHDNASSSDGSHRTISCTPATNCGEILARLLRKLGLSEGAQEYALQIKYTYSGKLLKMLYSFSTTFRILF